LATRNATGRRRAVSDDAASSISLGFDDTIAEIALDGNDLHEGVAGFFAKRPPDFKGR
jgi:hypothetical protein